MKLHIFGDSKDIVKPIFEGRGADFVEDDPDYVVSFGGDGTLMKAEFAYPGVPKLLLRNSAVCKKCSPLPNDDIVSRFFDKRFSLEEMIKIEVAAGGKKLAALNDVIIHNQDPRHAIRYKLWVDDKEISRTIIGDGAVIATPFGSSAYYRSITHSFFDTGLGIAFNNSTEPFDHMVVPDTSTVRILIERGPALVFADNQKEFLELKQGEEVLVKKHPQKAKLVKIAP